MCRLTSSPLLALNPLQQRAPAAPVHHHRVHRRVQALYRPGRTMSCPLCHPSMQPLRHWAPRWASFSRRIEEATRPHLPFTLSKQSKSGASDMQVAKAGQVVDSAFKVCSPLHNLSRAMYRLLSQCLQQKQASFAACLPLLSHTDPPHLMLVNLGCVRAAILARALWLHAQVERAGKGNDTMHLPD